LVLAAVFLSLFTTNIKSQKIAVLEVDLEKAAYGLGIPVSINLDNVTYISDTLLALYEVKKKSRIVVPFQIEPGDARKLTWEVATGKGQGENTSMNLFRANQTNQMQLRHRSMTEL
jgi:hypothetical protein